MHCLLLRATPLAAVRPEPRAILAWVAAGTAEAAQGLVLGELHRAGWKVLEVVAPDQVRRELPGLKRHPDTARALAAARERGLAFLVLQGPAS